MADPIAVPDNTPEGIAHSNLITISRAFVRGKGAPDHLFSDDVVIAEYNRFKAGAASNWSTPFVLNLPTVTTTFNTTSVPFVVKKAEYSTIVGDTVPYYGDKAESDWPTPSDPNLPVVEEPEAP